MKQFGQACTFLNHKSCCHPEVSRTEKHHSWSLRKGSTHASCSCHCLFFRQQEDGTECFQIECEVSVENAYCPCRRLQHKKQFCIDKLARIEQSPNQLLFLLFTSKAIFHIDSHTSAQNCSGRSDLSLPDLGKYHMQWEVCTFMQDSAQLH